jgi:serine protease
MKYSSLGKKRSIAALMVAVAFACAVARAVSLALALALAPGPAALAGASSAARSGTAPPPPLAHMAGATSSTFVPNDPGTAGVAGGWQKLQWNFADSTAGVSAPEAWRNLIRDHHPGGSGVVVAVLDTGVAYRNWDGFRKSPDFAGTTFVDPCDLVAGTVRDGRCTDPYALDREGHGTFVASEIAEATNNHLGVTGLAYGAAIMPVRVLNAAGFGYPTTVAEGIRYAVAHGAQVINLSLAFYLGLSAAQIPTLTSAIAYAHAHGVILVGAAGNDGADEIAYPAADPDVISVGASTADGCLAAYSNTGPKLDLVAPGGGDDAALRESMCNSNRNLPNVYQETFTDPGDPDSFSLPSRYYGTSMSAPEVSAAAAMVIASRVLGAHPSPAAVLLRLEETATKPVPGPVATRNNVYGYGIVNAGAATSPLAQAVTAPAPVRTP